MAPAPPSIEPPPPFPKEAATTPFRPPTPSRIPVTAAAVRLSSQRFLRLRNCLRDWLMGKMRDNLRDKPRNEQPYKRAPRKQKQGKLLA